MGLRYTYPKEKLNFKIHNLYIFFYDGNYISISEQEIVSANINYYDKPIWEEDCYCPVAESGFIKLKISKKIQRNQYVFLHDESKYIKDRKFYIENRCVNEGQIKGILLYDENNWHLSVFGNIVAVMDGEYLLIKFVKNDVYGSANGKDLAICLNEVDKSDIFKIDLDFENCESFYVYSDEILDINLTFNKQLESNHNFYRKIDDGYLRIKLEKEDREYHFFYPENKKLTNKFFEKRLCGKKGEEFHNICHLYVSYLCFLCGTDRRECMEVDDYNSDEDYEKVEALEDELGKDLIWFIGGYCKKLSDGSILIAFGKQAKTTVEKYIEKMEE
jgi:hypothetical protein